ncbi:PAS domain S-box protein [Paraburkholderia panacisoli]|uniref:PAS domain S-box protein n=1 Tax=Paraburkholderia panacisoli TaxID=2603818 RepID=A0A5B0GY64_9BURK|nr:PAS domain S-box protein [Paraburkholderia panacisoli]
MSAWTASTAPCSERTRSRRRQRKDGSLFPVEVRARVFNHSGRLFAIALARDMTDRRHREQRLLAEFSVASTLSEAGTLDEAVPRILHETCKAFDWDSGASIWRRTCWCACRHGPRPPSRGPVPSYPGRPASTWGSPGEHGRAAHPCAYPTWRSMLGSSGWNLPRMRGSTPPSRSRSRVA